MRGVALKGRTLDNLFRDATPHERSRPDGRGTCEV
jgi:hypothetical protein